MESDETAEGYRGNFPQTIRILIGIKNSRWVKTIDTITRSTSLTIITNCLLTLSLNSKIKMSQTKISTFPTFNFLLGFL